jgi:hypothetical protein
MSPLIATTILIVVAVSLGGIIAAWQAGFLQSFSGSLRESVKLELQCRQASISIDSASYNCQNLCFPNVDHTLALQATNRGNLALTITYVYLKNSTGGLFEFPFFTQLGAGQSVQLLNVSREPCDGINRTLDEIVLLTQCLDTAAEFPGESVTWINC